MRYDIYIYIYIYVIRRLKVKNACNFASHYMLSWRGAWLSNGKICINNLRNVLPAHFVCCSGPASFECNQNENTDVNFVEICGTESSQSEYPTAAAHKFP